uniref:peptidylprolyl isomerase n=1 Tax=Chromera velia CCMP2878 TaxID=1169474 RepID=A0A0G4IE06_9ALVE|mmetsp:Transcript_42969/g.84726  ORF Transcript_42969/g.84726 Transcript_42969/m.84726 type:complete len:125 (-) Transcript_42969:117-491(-)|eukprot:Cvel_13597.t1-p1 / transcript=Cvel_13597.t1 / gene=Cvel_13597 / organism=Chromera_velia_CCMP2878 / gene_product=Peptidyl-prolyl cis-trans isomerase FKBP12, putative / transcript_product=Peptidyl-prolyl cis-trans isomerase FKBP12, putative / location=Cvel_scaffold935:56521-58036(-) / protein_length=124 / sequence_SO=supercontig / SO=protein_coding / is_pseudo=false
MALKELQKEVLVEGSGKEVEKGNVVTCHALGQVLNPDGSLTKFWSTKDVNQQPFVFRVGEGQVIHGWDVAVIGMKEGEVAKMMIPANMGYGENGFPAWGIPPQADLCFEVQLLKVKGADSDDSS